MKKKIVTLMLATVLTASALTACGSSSDSSASFSASASSASVEFSDSSTETTSSSVIADVSAISDSTATENISEESVSASSESSENFSELDSLQKDLANMRRESSLHSRMQTEINKMKKGSIALVGQITTISKIRIYDPKTNYDILSNVKLSNEMLDRIDNEIIKKFTGLKKYKFFCIFY